jgi:pimeloyl-ACP methyl ester carboxylesterase
MTACSSNFLQYKNSRIHYLQFGEGDKLLFAFHGFSESGESFLPLSDSLGKLYRVVAIDIPYHGKTEWLEQSWFNKYDLTEIIRLLRIQNNVDRFSVLGFSMGGKCALFTVKSFGDKIDALFLLASDGIKTNKLYNVAVYPKWGRQLFKTTINHPGWFFFFIKAAHRMKLITPWLYKFTYNHMNTEQKRKRLYNTWISMSQLNPDIKMVQDIINQYNIKTYLFFGLKDEVIPVTVGEYFAEKLKHHTLVKLERGHYFIDASLNAHLSRVLE